MSSFTRFNARMATQYNHNASVFIKRPHYNVVGGFRYYIGDLDSSKWVDVPDTFLTDIASVPSLLQGFIPANGSYGQAAVLHDRLCEEPYYWDDVAKQKIMITRKEADQIFFEAMQVLEVEKWRYELIRLGINAYRIVYRPDVPHMDARKLKYLVANNQLV